MWFKNYILELFGEFQLYPNMVASNQLASPVIFLRIGKTVVFGRFIVKAFKAVVFT